MDKKPNRITLRDIARKSSVSPSTVSRVLNNYPYVDEDTRASVWQAARELGYPMKNLRSIPVTSQFVLLTGMLLNDVEAESDWLHTPEDNLVGTEFLRKILIGARNFLELNGIGVRLPEYRNKREKDEEIRQYIGDPGLLGLILVGGYINYDFVHGLQAAGLPFVIAGGRPRSLQADYVIADYADGVEQAVVHLAAIGRRHICLANGPSYTTTSDEKLRGFRLALCMHDLAYDAERVVSSDFTPELGYEHTMRLLAQAPDLDAIIFGDDYMAMGGLRALKESGRRVPDDVAIIGIHDYQIAGYTDPPLTTVAFDDQMMGIIAARRLYMMIEAPDDQAWSILVPTSLVTRESA